MPRSSRNAQPLDWLLFAPLAGWLALFVVAPTLLLVAISFCERDFLGRVVWHFTLENYRRAFSPVYLAILVRSLGVAALATAICLLAAYPAAYAMARGPERWRRWLLFLVVIPFWTSFLVRTYAWITILAHDGLLNALLAEPASMLYTPGAVLIGLVHNYLPFAILPIYASVEKMDRSLVEAARDLGAGPWRAFWGVTLPLTAPGVIGAALLILVPAIAMFAIVSLMGGGGAELIGNTIQKQFTSGRNQPFGAALGTLLLLVFLTAFALAARLAPRSRRKEPL